MKFRILFLFLIFFIIVRASEDDENETESNDNENDTGDDDDDDDDNSDEKKADYKSTISRINTIDSPNKLNDSYSRPLVRKKKAEYRAETNFKLNQTSKTSSNLRQPEIIHPNNGLSSSTINLISRYPPCKRQFLLNYNRLLRSPNIRLQFYRDLYQLNQSELIPNDCGEGVEKVKLGFRERAVLLKDPFFRAKVEKLMRKRQPIGLAISGPIKYPNDILLDNNVPAKNILTISKQY